LAVEERAGVGAAPQTPASNTKGRAAHLRAREGGGAGEHHAQNQKDRRDRAVEQAFEIRNLQQGHDKVSFWFHSPLREAVRSGQCLDTTYLNDVKIIFTAFGFRFTVTAMREAATALAPIESARPYHHGNLAHALVLAGRRILEAEGPAALSLRAVAREAGVSPAAPYHHFKDKGELLDAVASEGWHTLGEMISAARACTYCPEATLTEIGVAYVKFARANPALYRIMYDMACDRETMPMHAKTEDSAWTHVAEAITKAGSVDPTDARDMQLAQIALWCAAHGVAEMAGFKEFEPLKEALGGEEAFVRALFARIGVSGLSRKQAH